MAKVIHEPNLQTILMVENAIKSSNTYQTKTQLWKSLPRKIQYQTFTRVLEYLECSNKITFNKAKITWIFPDNPKLKQLLDNSTKL